MKLLGKSKVLSRNGGVILGRDVPVGHVLDAGIVAVRGGKNLHATVSRKAAHSLGRVQERDSGKVFRSYFCPKSINRWCTNAMLARLNARNRLQKSGGSHIGVHSRTMLWYGVPYRVENDRGANLLQGARLAH